MVWHFNVRWKADKSQLSRYDIYIKSESDKT